MVVASVLSAVVMSFIAIHNYFVKPHSTLVSEDATEFFQPSPPGVSPGYNKHFSDPPRSSEVQAENPYDSNIRSPDEQP